ncbi:hypothetical protein B0J13DRAFT_126050 [Dactylonectria estremocensis]|uniref:Uncharacterized protein n=1 Tax=Dactylonectria estremocensis TaxID=1079267 RepID=A0A9P9JG92_9HYPO|nr:hypothetical protein B0J13DRAFT_126050 [Dactylonectria estremocensis]
MTDNEHPEDSALYYCITEARCRLCQSTLKDNKFTQVWRRPASPRLLLTRNLFPAVGDDHVSDELEFHQLLSVYDEDLDINIHLCLGHDCAYRAKAIVCFHSRCYEFRSYPVTPPFLAAVKYVFVAPAREEQRRADYFQRALARSLQCSWPVSPRELPPPELGLVIAKPLVKECAVLNTEELVHRSDTIGNSIFHLTQPVHAAYVKVDGRYYVQSLLNVPRTDACKQAYPSFTARTNKQRLGVDDDESKDLFRSTGSRWDPSHLFRLV